MSRKLQYIVNITNLASSANQFPKMSNFVMITYILNLQRMSIISNNAFILNMNICLNYVCKISLNTEFQQKKSYWKKAT